MSTFLQHLWEMFSVILTFETMTFKT